MLPLYRIYPVKWVCYEVADSEAKYATPSCKDFGNHNTKNTKTIDTKWFGYLTWIWLK